MAVVGRGQITSWEGASLWVMTGTRERVETDFHAHHVIQLTLALEGSFLFRTSDETLSGPVVAVAPDVPHLFEARGAAAHLFIEPESRPGRAMLTRWFGESALRQLPAQPLAGFAAELGGMLEGRGQDLRAIGRRMIDAICGSDAHVEPDDRVSAIVAFVADSLEDAVTLSMVAAHVGLSPSRTSHLFVEQTGMPLRTYVLWRRLERAVDMYAQGASLTDAAHAAGFADSAHLSRTFRRMFGLPANALKLQAQG